MLLPAPAWQPRTAFSGKSSSAREAGSRPEARHRGSQVSLSSLNRHAVATRADVGLPKAAVLARHFAGIVPEAQARPAPPAAPQRTVPSPLSSQLLPQHRLPLQARVGGCSLMCVPRSAKTDSRMRRCSKKQSQPMKNRSKPDKLEHMLACNCVQLRICTKMVTPVFRSDVPHILQYQQYQQSGSWVYVKGGRTCSRRALSPGTCCCHLPNFAE